MKSAAKERSPATPAWMRNWRSVVFMVLILILALLCHYPIHIADAVTRTPVSEFGVHISWLRMILEPFVGPLLFLLRADQALAEMLMVMVWLMVGLGIAALVRSFQKRKTGLGAALLRGLLSWLTTLPMILAVWIGLILIVIFAPLPGNTIVKRSKDAVLLNTHSHTHWSHDGIISPEGLAQWHRRNGFDAFFLTEHNHHRKTLELVAAQKRGEWLQEPLLLCGEEYSGTNHIVLLGLTRDFVTKDMPDSTAIDSAQANGGVGIMAHWFDDEKKSIRHYIDQGADGFEIANQNGGIYYERRIFDAIVEECKNAGLLLVGACDYHGYGAVAMVWNALQIPGWHEMPQQQKREAILDILRRHDQSRLRVLVYRDRDFLPERLLWLSPIWNFLGYFRSLNLPQVLSWYFWLWLFSRLSFAWSWLRRQPGRGWSIPAAVASAWTVSIGLRLLAKAPPLHGYNDIYQEYGTSFLWAGLLLFVYAAAWLASGLARKKRLP